MEPAAATQHSAAGAKAFAEFFIKTIDWGYATTSSAYMRHYFEPSCDGCNVVARLLDNAHRLGHHYIGGRITIRSVRLLAFGTRTATDLHLAVTSVEAVDRNGHATSADVAYPDLSEHLELTWRGAWWASAMKGQQ